MYVASTDGYGFEQEVLSVASVDVNPNLREVKRHKRYDFWKEIEKVRECQEDLRWDPRRPRTVLSKSMFDVVAHALRDGDEKLYLYSSVGTILDVRWGVDCFFQYEERVVTIDLTVRPFKDRYKAHFLITRNCFLRNKHYGIARSIARKLSPRR